MLRSIFFAPLIAALVAAVAGAQTRSIQRLNAGGFNPNGSNRQDGITVAADGCRFVAVFAEQNGVSESVQDIWAAVSTDDGVTWQPMVRVDQGDAPNTSDSQFPKVGLLADGTIVCAWEERRAAAALGSSNQDVFFNRSTDGGLTWGPAAFALNSDTVATATSDIDRISLATSGNTIHVVWEEDRTLISGAEDLYYVRSTDSGATFSAPVRLNTQVPFVPPLGSLDPHNDVDEPKIVAEGTTVAVAFIDNRLVPGGGAANDNVWVLVSQDGGATFTETLIETDTTGDVDNVQVAIDGSVVAVCWADEAVLSGGAIHAQVSSDGGLTWLPSEVSVSPILEATPGAVSRYHHADVSGSDVYVVWTDDHLQPGTGDNGRKVYVNVSQDAGLTWSGETALDGGNPGRANHFCRVDAVGSMAFVHFETGSFGGNDLAYAVTNDRGTLWRTPFDVPTPGDTDSPNENEGTFFAVSPATLTGFSVWHDNPLGQNEVYGSAVRVPWLVTNGSPTPASPFGFGIRAVPAATAGSTFVVAVSATGTAPAIDLGNCFYIPLIVDPITVLAVTSPDLLAVLTGSIDPGPASPQGDGDAPLFPFPLPPGLTIYASGIQLDPMGQPVRATDAITVTGL